MPGIGESGGVSVFWLMGSGWWRMGSFGAGMPHRYVGAPGEVARREVGGLSSRRRFIPGFAGAGKRAGILRIPKGGRPIAAGARRPRGLHGWGATITYNLLAHLGEPPPAGRKLAGNMDPFLPLAPCPPRGPPAIRTP